MTFTNIMSLQLFLLHTTDLDEDEKITTVEHYVVVVCFGVCWWSV